MKGICYSSVVLRTICLFLILCARWNDRFPNLGPWESRYEAVPLSKRKPPSLQKNATLNNEII